MKEKENVGTVVRLLSLIFVIFLSVLLFRIYVKVPGITVYGREEPFIIQEEGTLYDLTEDKRDRTIKELIVTGKRNRCIVIPEDDLAEYRIQRGFTGWDMTAGNIDLIVKGVRKIYLDSGREDFGIYRLNYTEQIDYYSFYEHLKNLIVFDDYNERSGTLTTPLTCLLLEGIKADSVLFVLSNGKEHWQPVSDNGSLTLCPALFPYINPTNNSSLKIAWENPPQRSVLQVYDLLMNSVENAPTLAIFIDGLGYKLWEYAQENGFTGTFPDVDMEPMRAVYPPKTVYNYYAFGTGKLLASKEDRGKLFADFPTEEKKGIIVGGHIQMYGSPLRQKLHPPDINDLNIDRQIFESVKSKIGDYDFIFVHFHDIDINGHRYGAYSDKTLETVRRTGEYLSEMTDKWIGNMFIFSDHGMHTYYDRRTGEYAGTHYTGKAEDIISVFGELRTENEE